MPINGNDVIAPGLAGCACAIVVDTGSSMSGNEAVMKQMLAAFRETFAQVDWMLPELCLITSGDGRQLVEPFGPAAAFPADVPLCCAGGSANHAALSMVLEAVRQRNAGYKAEGRAFYRPMIFLLSDGRSSDADDGICAGLLQLQEERKIIVLGMGIGADVDADALKDLNVRRMMMRPDPEEVRELFPSCSSIPRPSGPDVVATTLELPQTIRVDTD